jgi:uncharacterized membrane protein YecN with MAPEG domain
MESLSFLPKNFGYVIAMMVAFWVQQSIIFVIPIAIQRSRTKIQPPVIYPNDSLIKELKLTEDQVGNYMRAQRVHQNNMEFLCVFMPIFFVAGLFNPMHTAIAGAAVWVGRLMTAMGYWHSAGARAAGGW